MTVQTIERDLAAYLENIGYKVSFRKAQNYHFIYVRVTYYGQVLSEQSVFGWWKYRRGARHARRVIRDHRRALRMLGGIA